MADRFILLNEKIFDWEWYDDLYMYKLFTSMILMASHKDTSYKGISLKRGSFITSLDKLHEKTHIGKSTIRRKLQKLTETGEITETVNNNYRIITIVNYDKYQVNSDHKKKTRGVTGDTPNEQTSEQAAEHHSNKYIYAPKGAYIYRQTKKTTHQRIPDYLTFRQFAETVDSELAEIFYDTFITAETNFPDDWQEVFTRFANAPPEKQNEFLNMLLTGQYKQKWGDCT